MLRSGTAACCLVLAACAAAFAEPPAKEAKLPKDLLEKRRDAAAQVYKENLTRLKAAQGLPSELFGWSERWLDAELALANTKDARARALKANLERTRDVERMAVGFAKTGQGRSADAAAATYYRVEAEIRLAKEGVEVPPEQPAKKPDKK